MLGITDVDEIEIAQMLICSGEDTLSSAQTNRSIRARDTNASCAQIDRCLQADARAGGTGAGLNEAFVNIFWPAKTSHRGVSGRARLEQERHKIQQQGLKKDVEQLRMSLHIRVAQN